MTMLLRGDYATRELKDLGGFQQVRERLKAMKDAETFSRLHKAAREIVCGRFPGETDGDDRHVMDDERMLNALVNAWSKHSRLSETSIRRAIPRAYVARWGEEVRDRPEDVPCAFPSLRRPHGRGGDRYRGLTMDFRHLRPKRAKCKECGQPLSRRKGEEHVCPASAFTETVDADGRTESGGRYSHYFADTVCPVIASGQRALGVG